ncbi:MAG: hypothetical protein H0X66_08520 [Verrucomicrobia bacterium]|nr:hypothetical protein [Verrucomicrobiota bacterium]
MNNVTLKVLINGELVGHMFDEEFDQPSFRASFLPKRSFDEYAPLFTKNIRAVAEYNIDELNRVSQEIDKLRISMESEGGQLHYSSDPSLRPFKRITAVRIRGREICFRPLD